MLDNAKAQAVASSTPKDDEEIVDLSPFIVSADSVQGYRATDTLAGTRIRTPIEDIGSSVSILTAELLKDTASTNMQSALVFATGTEVSNLGGNFSNSTVSANQRVLTEGGTSNTPGTRVRGLAAADLTRGYFRTVIPFDTFNTGTVEINRGSNAVLFGVGSPAGIINYNANMADLRRTFGSVQVSVDNFGSTREQADANIVVVPRQVSLRIAAMNDEKLFQQKPAFNHDKRFYGAVTISPEKLVTKRSGVFSGTTLRASYEAGDINANNPHTLPPTDLVTLWVRPTDEMIQNGMKIQGSHDATVPFPPDTVNAGIGVAGFGTLTRSPIFIFNNPGSPVASDLSGSIGRQWAGTRLTGGGTATGAMLSSSALPQILPSGIAGAIYYVSPSITDTSLFDYRNNLIEGPNKGETDRFHANTISVEQLMFRNRVGFELAFDDQSNVGRRKSATGTIVAVDANTTLIDGSPNYNYGRPFIWGAPTASYNRNEITTKRATAFGELDLAAAMKSPLGRILGRHVLTLLGQEEESFNEHRSGNYYVITDSYPYGLNQNRLATEGKAIFAVHYLGDSLAGATTSAGAHLQPISANVLNLAEQARQGTFVMRRQVAGAPFEPGIKLNILEADAGFTESASAATKSKRIIDSSAINLQSYWLGEHLISNFGLRHERVQVWSVNPPVNPGETNLLVNDPRYNFAAAANQVVSDSLKSASLVAKIPGEWVTHLPLISAIALHVNKSENFSPPVGVRYDSFGSILPPPVGSTEEFGATLKTRGDKAVLRLNWYKTDQSGITNGVLAPLTTRVVSLHRTAFNAVRDGIAANGGNGFPVGYIPPPQALLDLYKVNIAGNALTFVDPGVVATSDFVARGLEVELFLNLTRNWSVAVNAAKQESVRSNSGVALERFLFHTPLSNGKSLFDTWSTSDIPLFTGALTPGNTTSGFLGDNSRAIFNTYASTVYQDGGPAQELRKWRVNVVTKYKADHFVKGLWFGGALRWQDRVAIGFPLITVAGNLISDSKNPYWGSGETTVDLSAGYGRKVCRDRYKWSIQANVRNAFSPGALIPIYAQPTGEIGAYRIDGSRRIVISSSLEF